MKPSNSLRRHLLPDKYLCPHCGQAFYEIEDHLVRGAEEWEKIKLTFFSFCLRWSWLEGLNQR